MRVNGGKFEVSYLNSTNDDFINFVHYPKMNEGEFISLSLMQFNEVIN